MRWRDRIQWPRPSAWVIDEIAHSALCSRNPSSLHEAGRSARRDLDRLSEALLARLGLDPRDVDVVLTGGGVEAMQIAIGGRQIVRGARSTPIARAVVPASSGARGDPLAVLVDDTEGSVDRGPGHGVLDATVALGRCAPRDVPRHADIVVVAGELSGGPPGVGAVVRKRGVELQPLYGGGGQEHGVRPGTQPAALAAGWARALERPSGRRRLEQTATELAAALDSVGLKILKAPEPAAGIVVAAGPTVGALVARLARVGIEPAQLDSRTVRFAVDDDDDDDDIERLVAAIRTA